MKSFDRLEGLHEQRREEIKKIHQLEEKYESGRMPKEDYEKQLKYGPEKTLDILDKEIEDEIKNQGLSEQEYGEWKQEQEQNQEQGQDRGR